MDTLSAFTRAVASEGNRMKVFDWRKAAELIAERPNCEAEAGLGMDWENTGGCIWHNGKPMPRDGTYTYLASSWATPELDIDGWVTACWIYEDESPGWNASTYWPQEALDIIAAAKL